MRALIFILALSSCATVEPTVKYITIDRFVPVPVQCSEIVTTPIFDADIIPLSSTLESKVEAIVRTDVQRQLYAKMLESAFVKCGGTVDRPSIKPILSK